MKTGILTAACVGLLTSCGGVPKELVDARKAYDRAAEGPATANAPSELREANNALQAAEKSFEQSPRSYRTQDLAYVAERKAQIAEERAGGALANKQTVQAGKDILSTQNKIAQMNKEELAKAREELDQTKQDINDLRLELAQSAMVKQEARGMVITLSGSVLFASAQSALLPSARERLNTVAGALLKGEHKQLTVEGHTDSQGSHSYNDSLAQRRADSVRAYLVSRGYPADKIEAKGIGEDHPVAANTGAEGRANNRRVEIIIANDPQQE